MSAMEKDGIVIPAYRHDIALAHLAAVRTTVTFTSRLTRL